MSFVVTAATKLTRATPRRVRHFALDAGPSEPSPTHRDNLRFVRTDASTSALPPTPNTPNPSSSSSSAVPPNSIVLSPSAASDLPPPSPHPSPLPRVPFSTHTFVRRLESADVHRGLATEIMQATRSLMLLHEERAANELLSRADLENEAYLFTAALSELKTESSVKSRNDGIVLRSLTSALQRDTDAVSQKLKEDMQRLQSDIQLDMNSRKEETSQELKALDMNIMDLNSKFTILLGEVRTEIEATKWISTRRVMSAIIVVVVSVIAISTASTASKPPTPPPSIEELGVRPPVNGGEAEGEGNGAAGWFWSSTGASLARKNEGEEG